jgi:hypothetical protein
MAGQIVLTAASSGTVTLTPADTGNAFVSTIPARTGNVAVDGPAFSAWQSSSQSFTANTWTKVQFQTEEFDTASCFDNTTNYRFTPNVAGYYQVFGAFTNATILAQVGLGLYKNGVNYKRLYNGIGGGNTSSGCGGCIVYLNGTTDYIELYALTTSTQNAFNQSDSTYFQAAMVRGT